MNVFRTRRSAFSLLEMVIALAIGMLLLGALYAFMSMQITMTQAGRDLVEEGALVRAIFTRLSNDIISQVAPYDPRMVNAAPPATMASLGGSMGPTAASGTTTTTTTPSTSSSSSSSNASTTPPPSPVVTYNIGVYGTATMLQLSNYRVQTAPAGILTGSVDPNLEIISDVRRVSYWMSQDGANSQGLCRNEFRQATADSINFDPTSLPDQNKMIIAKEVMSITFEYYDGTTWQPQWDGTTLCDDEVTPFGPPVAIRITLTLRRNSGRGRAPVDAAADQGPTFQHVVALPSVNFFNQNQ